ncbi:hypothetical protein JM18_003142 [Phytophthora kernoviae]|uniref:Coronin n=2 Tax=Phytophthora kernoviae TaxID=325452 RepID=A0A8T0LWS2_9STRA|nr:hypothetical protein G195_010264 [Phytophthora kernoviae 00238/432]KAG2522743.1 hypothetical protein JM16_004436 [Phytophthora kernoviae]KAG2527425.1 hypothetical protein JM18_003142 [Phytophthora kernoviae]
MAPRFQFRASKFRNVECKLLPREQSFDQLQVSPSVDGNLLACSSKSFTFAHQMDGGGAIQVKSLSQTGKEAPSTPPLIRAHPTGRVTALAFSPFHEDLLLSAGDANATVKIWKLPSEPLTEDLRTPIATFQQETGTVAGIVPHPSADAVVATYSRPGALRVYDIEAEKLSYEVLQDGWTLSSAAWNWDGSLIVLPTQDQATCDTNVCEIARVLNLGTSGSSGGGSCEVVSYRVPRKDATHTFQTDLYPDTLALEAAMTAEEWQLGHNAEPMVQSIKPSCKSIEDTTGIVFGQSTTGVPVGSAWGVSASNTSHTATGSLDAPSEPKMTLLGHTKGLRALQFNPAAANVLCSTSQDLSLRFWDVETGQERLCVDGKLEDITWNMNFSDDGALLATASRAKIVRVFDPRQSEHALLALGCGHESSKPQFVVWLNANRLLTVGVGARNETQVSFWDARNLLEPLGEPVLVEPAASAASTTTPLPLYDPSSRLLFLVGTGSRHIWSYEVDPSTATLQANLPFMLAGTDTIGGVALLPKSLCNVRDVELAQLLVATPNVVERVSFSLPRAQKLKVFFQDDVFGPTLRQEPTLNAAQWFAGESAAPIYDSLRPDGMVPLSEKPKNVAPVRPKTLDFQAQLREEEEKERQKTAQFARLSTLAAQPSLHSTHHTGVKPPAPQTLDDDSDDDWDD